MMRIAAATQSKGSEENCSERQRIGTDLVSYGKAQGRDAMAKHGDELPGQRKEMMGKGMDLSGEEAL